MPSLPEADMSVPVVHQGDLLGAISIRMPRGEPLRPAGEQLVADVASQAGLVLSNAGLIEDLQASRQRLVAAQDEARRRLERNIHDGAQPRRRPSRSLANCRQTPRARWRTSATSPGASTRRCWPTWGWSRRSTPRPASPPCR